MKHMVAGLMTDNTAYRSAVGIALAAAFIIIYMEGALGINGPSDRLTILTETGVFAVGIIGALIARFQAHGMARALVATALAQALAAVIALSAGMHRYAGSSVGEILIVNGFFVALFVGSAWRFRHAAQEQPPAD